MRRATESISDRPAGTDTAPVAWFVEMIHALNRGDLVGALKAQGELERDGFRVTYLRSPEARKGQG